MSNQYRIDGGLVDYSQPLSFQFDNKSFKGYQGDTLASALLANGIRLMARSFKYHRPRGVMSAGYEEPNALVTLHKQQEYREPNIAATTVELYDGLQAYSQNYRGTLRHDFMAINDLLSPFLSAGFYYKTFMWPKSFWEKVYEPMIRRAAGLGQLSRTPDLAHYEKGFWHCDLLIVGGGVAGIQAALIAGRAGLRVLLAHEDFEFGGQGITDMVSVNSSSVNEWIKKSIEELESLSTVKLMKRTTVFGAYDHGVYGVLERVGDHKAPSCDRHQPRHVVWRVYAKQSLLCTGVTERPMVFHNNDRPGIMLANSVNLYAKRFGVMCGKNIIVYTNNDSGWLSAKGMIDQKLPVKAIIDNRHQKAPYHFDGVDIYMGKSIVDTRGRHAVSSIILDDKTVLSTDCVAVCAGWNPNVHLSCHQRNRPLWDGNITSFVPDESSLPDGMRTAGSVNGYMILQDIYADVHKKMDGIIEQMDGKKNVIPLPIVEGDISQYTITPNWDVKKTTKAFVDFQNDVTVKDINLACQEGFHSVEHVKRYTTLGMATDQGKTANVNAVAMISQCINTSIEQTGTTIYRPPYSPISIASLAGRSRAQQYRPYRLPPSHQWAKERGAVFVEAGMWLRAQWYPIAGETYWRESVDREVMATRSSVGVCDVSTLGKIDIKGKDAAAFLNVIYANGFATLAVNKVRYGLMLREDGIVMDDGTTARLSDTHYVMTTTTANAGNVFRHMEFCRQCLCPHMDVHIQSITDYYAQYAIAGPRSRTLLQRIVDKKYDISHEAFPFMGCEDITICQGIPARLFRISFSGELAYEISVPARYGDALIRLIMQVGDDLGVTPYGTEALGVMRVEKGHPAGNELTGQTCAHHLGMGKLLAKKKDFIGKPLSQRTALIVDDGFRLVGIKPKNSAERLYTGAHFIVKDKQTITENDEGWISSVVYSPSLKTYIGLGFLLDGQRRFNECVRAVSLVHKSDIEVEIVSPHMFDPKGERMYV